LYHYRVPILEISLQQLRDVKIGSRIQFNHDALIIAGRYLESRARSSLPTFVVDVAVRGVAREVVRNVGRHDLEPSFPSLELLNVSRLDDAVLNDLQMHPCLRGAIKRLADELTRLPAFRPALDRVSEQLRCHGSLTRSNLIFQIEQTVGSDLMSKAAPPLWHHIQEAAYYLWIARGKRFGYQESDWLTAEDGLWFAHCLLHEWRDLCGTSSTMANGETQLVSH